jgi:hypothetical protein
MPADPAITRTGHRSLGHAARSCRKAPAPAALLHRTLAAKSCCRHPRHCRLPPPEHRRLGSTPAPTRALTVRHRPRHRCPLPPRVGRSDGVEEEGKILISYLMY